MAGTPNKMLDTVCYGAPNNAITLSGNNGTKFQWYDSVSGGSKNTRGVANTYPANTLTSIQSKTYVWVEVANGVCPPVNSDVVVIDTFARAKAGVLGGFMDSACVGESTFKLDSTDAVMPQGKLVRWQHAVSKNGPWVQLPSSEVSTAPGGLADGDSAYYRAIVYNHSFNCPGDTSDAVAVRWDKPINPKTITTVPASGPICESDVELHYTGAIPPYFQLLKWRYQENATTNPIINYEGLTTIDTTVHLALSPTLPVAIEYYFSALIKNGACALDSVTSGPLRVDPGPEAIKIKPGYQDTICAGSSSSSLITLASKPKVSPTWQYNSNPPVDGGWKELLGTKGDSTITVPAGLMPQPVSGTDTTYTIRVQYGNPGASSCAVVYSDTITLTIMAQPSLLGVTLDAFGGLNACLSEDSLRIDALTTSEMKNHWAWWMKAPGASDSTATGLSGVGSPITSYVEKPLKVGTYEFHLQLTNSHYCNPVSSFPSLKVTVWDTVNAGVITPDEDTVCQGTSINFTVADYYTGGKNVQYKWMVREPGGDWRTSIGSPAATFAGTHDTVSSEFMTRTGTITDYEIALAYWNDGCSSDTSNIVKIKTISAPDAPTLALPAVVCKDSLVTLTVGNLKTGDSLEIKRNGTVIKTVEVTARPEMKVQIPADLVGTNQQFIATVFVAGMRDNPCAFKESNTAQMSVSDSSKAGTLTFAEPSGAFEKTISDGTATGSMMLDGTYTVGTTTIKGEKNEWMGGLPDGIKEDSWNSWYISGTNSAGTSGTNLYTRGLDSIQFRAFVQNPGCPPDTSNWVNIIIEPADSIIVGLNDSVCNESPAGMKLVYANIGNVTGLSNEYWEKIVYPADGSPAQRTEKYKTGAANRILMEFYTGEAPGLYCYVYHYNNASGPKTVPDTVKIRVDGPSVAGTISASYNELCEDSIAPVLHLTGQTGTVTKWEFTKDQISYGAPSNGNGAGLVDYQAGNQSSDSGYYRVWVQNGTCPAKETSPLYLVKVYPETDAGTLEQPEIPCFGAPVTIKATGYNGVIKEWDYSEDGGTSWSTVSATSSPIEDNPLLTWSSITKTMMFKARVKNGNYCGLAETPAITVKPWDKIELPEPCEDTIRVSAIQPEVSWTIGATGAGITGAETVTGDKIAYKWQFRMNSSSLWQDLIPGTNPPVSTDSIYIDPATGYATRLTVRKGLYGSETYRDVEYRVIATQTDPADCGGDTSCGRRIIVDEELAIDDPLEVRCIIEDSVVTIEPEWITGNYEEPVEWYWTPDGGAKIKIDCGSLPSWIQQGCGTTALTIKGDPSLADGRLTLVVTNEYGKTAEGSVDICIVPDPDFDELIGDTACVLSDVDKPGRFEPTTTSTSKLEVEWLRIAGTDTLSISKSKAKGAATRPNGTATSLQPNESLSNYDIVYIDRGLGDGDSITRLKFNDVTKEMNDFKYVARITSPNKPGGVVMSPRYLEAKLTVVDSIRLDMNYPQNDTICHLETAMFRDSVLTDRRFYDVEWYGSNNNGGPMTWFLLGTDDSYTTTPLQKNDNSAYYFYYYKAKNICNEVDSRVAEAVVRDKSEPAELTMSLGNPLCEGDELKIYAERKSEEDTLIWLVNGSPVSLSRIPMKPAGFMLRPFVSDQDSLMMGWDWNTPYPVDSEMDSVVFTVKVTNKYCEGPDTWISDSIRIRINEKGVFDHPMDVTIELPGGGGFASGEFVVNAAPGSDYEWYWTEPVRPSDKSFEEGAQNLRVDQSNALGAMIRVPISSETPVVAGTVGANGEAKLTLTVGNDYYNDVMFACVISSNTCGIRKDTTLFARLTIDREHDSVVKTGFKQIEICTDNYNTVDSSLFVEVVPKGPTPVSYQWEYMSDTLNGWLKVDPRKSIDPASGLSTANNPRLIINSVHTLSNMHWYRCKINNAFYSDTFEIKVDLIPHFTNGPRPFRTPTDYRVWPQVEVPSVIPQMLSTPESSLGYPSMLEQVYTQFDTAVTPKDQREGNKVKYTWYRAEKGSPVFAKNISPFNNDSATWTLYDLQTHEADDSIRVVVQLSNEFCTGEADTVLIIVPNCNIDTIWVEPTTICIGSEVTLTARPETDQNYKWWYKNADGTGETEILNGSSLGTANLTVNGNSLTISAVTAEMADLLFNVEVDDPTDHCGGPQEQLWTKIGMEMTENDLILSAAKLAGDTLKVYAIHGETAKERVEIHRSSPTRAAFSSPGYHYDWYVITESGDSLVAQTATSQWDLEFNAQLNGYELFAVVTSPSACDSTRTDTIVLKMISTFDVFIDPATQDLVEIVSCGDVGICIPGQVSPASTNIVRWQWQYSDKDMDTWMDVTAGYPNFVQSGTFAQKTLCFTMQPSNLADLKFRVIGWDASDVADTSNNAIVVKLPGIDAWSSTATRIPELGDTVCVMPNTQVIYTAHAMPEPPKDKPYLYTWTVRYANGVTAPPHQDHQLILDVGDDIDRYQGAVITVTANLEGCAVTALNFRDTLRLQSVDSVKISWDTSVHCSSFPITFSTDYAFNGRAYWEAFDTLGNPVGTPPAARNTNTYSPKLPVGWNRVALEVMEIGSVCVARDTVLVEIESGIPMKIEMDGVIVAPPYKLINMNSAVNLTMNVTEDGVDTTGMGLKFKWTVIDYPTEYPLALPDDAQSTRTDTIDQAAIRQRILAEVTDFQGCVSQDTVIIETRTKFVLDLVDLDEISLRPDLSRDTITDTTFLNHPNLDPWPTAGELLVCNNDIIYLTPKTLGGIEPLTYRFEASEVSEVYIDDVLQGSHLSWEGTDSVVGFRTSLSAGRQVTYRITIADAMGAEKTTTVNVSIRNLPHVRLFATPKMYNDAYYYNQVIHYELSPVRFQEYAFYRFILNDLTGEYELNPDPENTGSNNPQKGSNPMFVTTYKAGEDSNMVVGFVRDEYGCENSDTLQLKLIPIPNVVIPDDIYYPLNRVFLPDFDVEVRDSWGLKIKDYGTKGWDATYKNKKVRSGTYYYNAKVPTPEGITIISGAVTVMREGDRP